jgi:hypothetical protein
MPLYTPSVTAPVPAAGQYAFPISGNSTGTSPSLGVGTLRVLPWVVTRTFSIDRIGGEVTAIGDVGSLLRLGVYADNGNAYPGALVLDAGTIAGDSATAQQVTCALTLAPGLYWIGGAVQAVTTTQPTVRIVGAFAPTSPLISGTSIPGANAVVQCYAQTSVTGALPATFSTTIAVSITPAPRLFVRAA